MASDVSGDYYDYTVTMQPERPWLVNWHQRYVWRIMHAVRGGDGGPGGNPELTAKRPAAHSYVGGDGKMAQCYLTCEQSLAVIKRVHALTAGVPSVCLLTGWQYEGHDSKFPAWGEVNAHLKRPQDATALESLRWLIREARRYNCLATLHINMFDAYPDSPLFDEYVAKDVIAKDREGRPIIGNRWWGMDCYHVSYTQEWRLGLAQKRIDDLIAMVPEIQENHCVYLDAFLGARVAEQQGPISPYLGISKEEEARTQRKIFRYWRDRGIDVASEYVIGMRVDRFVGLQPHSAAQGELIEDLPDALYCSNPAHFNFPDWNVPDPVTGEPVVQAADDPAFDTMAAPAAFRRQFWLEFLPWFYTNHPAGSADYAGMLDDGDICMPALWCAAPTLVAYSRDGYAARTWRLPATWPAVERVALARLTPDGPAPVGELAVTDGAITLAVGADEALRITPVEEPTCES